MTDEEVKEKCPPRIAKGIINVRKGELEIAPGYDGEYGKVKVFKAGDAPPEKQMELF